MLDLDQDIWELVILYLDLRLPDQCGTVLSAAKTCTKLRAGVLQAIPQLLCHLRTMIQVGNKREHQNALRCLCRLGALALPHIEPWLCPVDTNSCMAALTLLQHTGCQQQYMPLVLHALQRSLSLRRPTVQEWACSECTFFNQPKATSCVMCLEKRPLLSKEELFLSEDSNIANSVISPWTHYADMMDPRLAPQHEFLCVLMRMPPDPKTLPILMSCITADCCPSVKPAAVRALKRLGPSIVPQLKEVLHLYDREQGGPSYEVKSIVRLALTALGQQRDYMWSEEELCTIRECISNKDGEIAADSWRRSLTALHS